MFAGFNQDATNLAIGNATGFQVFEVPPRASFRRLKKEASLGGISIVALLEGTPLLAVVGSGNISSADGGDAGGSEGLDDASAAPPLAAAGCAGSSSSRLLTLFDANANKVIATVQFATPVVGVRMNRCRLVVILERCAHIYDLATMTALPHLQTDVPNKLGVGALSAVLPSNTCFFVCPYPEQVASHSVVRHANVGRAAVVDAMSPTRVEVVAAHAEALAAIEFCANGTRFATVSVKGTTIKVFSCPRPRVLFVFRRGQREALVHSLSLSPGGEMVAMTSNTGTLHLFSCAEGSQSSSVDGVRSFGKITLPDASYCVCKISDDCCVVSVVTPLAAGQRAILAQYTIDTAPKLLSEFPLQ